jgi:hypothetical protein
LTRHQAGILPFAGYHYPTPYIYTPHWPTHPSMYSAYGQQQYTTPGAHAAASYWPTGLEIITAAGMQPGQTAAAATYWPSGRSTVTPTGAQPDQTGMAIGAQMGSVTGVPSIVGEATSVVKHEVEPAAPGTEASGVAPGKEAKTSDAVLQAALNAVSQERRDNSGAAAAPPQIVRVPLPTAEAAPTQQAPAVDGQVCI